MQKIFYFPDIPANTETANKKIVFTNGCFDILHPGHVRYLEQARSLGDVLIVGVNSDASVKKIKGENRPVNNENDRAYILSALKCVDFTVIFNEPTPVELIKKLKPDIHVKGGDYQENDLPEAGIVKSYGGKVVILLFYEGYSTTAVIDKIRSEKKPQE